MKHEPTPKYTLSLSLSLFEGQYSIEELNFHKEPAEQTKFHEIISYKFRSPPLDHHSDTKRMEREQS
jgi:hypothetical protein